MPVTYAGLSSAGKRKRNEDSFLIKALDPERVLLAVADGLGGQPSGHIASRTAIRAIEDLIPGTGETETEMAGVIMKAEASVTELAETDPALEYMGTTLTVALFDKDTITWGHVGDARIYHLKEGRFSQMTTDQTMAQFLVEEGEITREEAVTHPMQHFLAQSLGGGGCEPETGSFKVGPGDIVLLCSDGLYSEIDDDRIIALLSSKNSVEEKVRLLVKAADDAGGHDNITVLGLEC
jgi:protein phosphatase